MKKKSDRNRKLAVIHVAKKQLGLSDDDYCDILIMLTGKESCGNMNPDEHNKVIRYFEKLGFVSSKGKPTGNAPMIRKIAVQLSQMNLPWSFAHGVAKRLFKVERLEWCSEEQLWKVIAALANIRKRRGITDEDQSGDDIA